MSPSPRNPPGLLLVCMCVSLWYSAKLGLLLEWVQRLPPGQATPQIHFSKDMDNAWQRLGIAVRWLTLELW